MRMLDIGVAAGYAILCISLISLQSPYASKSASVTADSDARASLAIASYLKSVGLPYLATSPPSQVCASLSASSNTTVVLGGVIRGEPCAPEPSHPLGFSSLVLYISNSEVEIEAWIEGP